MMGRYLLSLAMLVVGAQGVQAEPNVAPMAREVLIICRPADDFAINTAAPFPALSLVLNHLGLLPRFVDISKGLPDATISSRARGVMVYLEAGDAPDPEALDRWLLQRLQAGQRLALLTGLPPLVEGKDGEALPRRLWGPLLEALDTDADGLVEDVDEGVEVLPRSISDAEAEQPVTPRAFWHATATGPAAPLVTLRRQTGTPREAAALVVGPHGLFCAAPEYVFEFNPLTYVARWRIEPFSLFAKTFGVQGVPVPDPTTLNGRRVFFAHIDGDGFDNPAIRRNSDRAARIVLEEVLQKTDLPTTVSVVAGELAGKPELEAIARSIFALPNVEAASHTYTHPHDYAAGTVTHTVGGVDLDGDGVKDAVPVKLDPIHEVDDSIHYIEHLLPPGKRVNAVLWSGRTNPTPAFLARTAACGVTNLNGGDARVENQFPSLTTLAPFGRFVGPFVQVHAGCANENVFTNRWTGPFDGQRRALDVYNFAESPRRLLPVDIYYHFFAAERLAGLSALLACYRWAQQQPLAPIFASTYARMVEGFYSAQVRPLSDDTWHVEHLGSLRTLRFDDELRLPDLSASSGVAGYHRGPGNRLYVHLSGDGAKVVLAAAPPLQPHLDEANAQLTAWEAGSSYISASFSSTVNAQVKLAGLEPGRALRLAGEFKGPTRVAADGSLVLMGPRGASRLEVRW